jgi:diguanylate cyclase (GGDEF)-like protein
MAATERLSVLVVEDDEAMRELVAHMVTRLGHAVVTASDGLEAWETQQAKPADVILSDWSMPRMSGVELCRSVRAVTASYTYFVLMTARGKAHFVEGMRAGADDYLQKPVDLDELEARLRSGGRVVAMQRALVARNLKLARDSDALFDVARVDALTQSGNRLRLREDLEELEGRAARYGHRYTAGLADIDLFKTYNDTNGHLAGDDALRRVASAMSGALRKGDSLYRYGGEEFLLILPEQGLAEAREVMERVRRRVEALAIRGAGAAGDPLTVSIGVAELQYPATSEDWLRRADSALYAAKRNGRNRVEVDGTSLSTEATLAKPPLDDARGPRRVRAPNRTKSLKEPGGSHPMSNTSKRIRGAAKQAGGTIKKAVGKAIGNQQMEAEGRVDEIAGAAEQTTAKASERVKGAVEEAGGSIKKAVGKLIDNDQMTLEGKAKEAQGSARQKLNK